MKGVLYTAIGFVLIKAAPTHEEEVYNKLSSIGNLSKNLRDIPFHCIIN